MPDYKKYYKREEEGQCYTVCRARTDILTGKSEIKIGSGSCRKCESFINKGVHNNNKYYVICKIPDKEI